MRNFYHVKTLDGRGNLVFDQPRTAWANALNDAEESHAPTVYIMLNGQIKALFRHGKQINLPAIS